MTSTKVSIIIATYRRPAMLRDSVLSLQTLKIPSDVSLQVLIIDNDPQCSAASVMEELTESCAKCFSLRYVSEKRVGLSHARNCGIDEARGDVIALLDDDVYVDENWLVAMLECLDRNDAAAIGGRMINHWESEPDPTVRACELSLVAADLGDHDCAVQGRMTPAGGNCLFRRRVFDAGLRFSTELGRIGDMLLSGEDTELFRRLQRRGDTVWYCASGIVQHRIGGERLTQGYLIRRSYWFGYSYAIIDRRVDGLLTQLMHATARIAKLLLVDTVRLAWSVLRRSAEGKLIARCSIAKQWGYVRATWFPMSIASKPAPRAATPLSNQEPLEAPTVSSR